MKSLLEYIYPNTCFWCDKIKKENPCLKCNLELRKIIKYNVKINVKYDFHHFYLCKYQGKIRQKILDFKFGEKNYYKNGFANLIINNKKIYLLLKKYDIITSVPIHKKRKKERGYNQCDLISKEIAKAIPNLKFENDILVKIKNTKPQSTLDSKKRKENVIGVYCIKNVDKIKNKKIILFDDIYTTGSTVQECVKILKYNGAKKVDVLTIAKD